MKQEALKNLFLTVVADAIAKAQQLSPRPLPPDFKIELHGGGIPGEIVTLDHALNHMFVSEDMYFAYVDIGLKRVEKNQCIVFVRISNHAPVAFEKTWNTPNGYGPFKVILPSEIQFTD